VKRAGIVCPGRPVRSKRSVNKRNIEVDALAVSTRNDVYDELGVRIVINAQGNRTVLGGATPVR